MIETLEEQLQRAIDLIDKNSKEINHLRNLNHQIYRVGLLVKDLIQIEKESRSTDALVLFCNTGKFPE